MEQKKSKGIVKTFQLQNGIQASSQGSELHLKGPKGEVTKKLASANVLIKVEGSEIKFSVPQDNRRFRKVVNTFIAHTKNMEKGVTEGHHYLLRICSGHFPMNVSVSKTELVVKNYVGERVPRSVKIPIGVEVKLNGRDISVDSTNKDLAGNFASRIEGLTQRNNFDKRRFQDGIHMVIKDGKEVK